ncbi:MAG: DUF3783 domain-containing protein [Pseudomonadota bacterium]
MNDGSFERVSVSDNRLYGPRKVLFCGFLAKAHPAVAALLKMVGLEDVGAIYAGPAQVGETVGDLFQLPGGTGEGRDSDLPRAIILGGITEKELHQLMEGTRLSRMQPPLWAVLTPVSENWTLADLLRELAAERAALNRPDTAPS